MGRLVVAWEGGAGGWGGGGLGLVINQKGEPELFQT